MYIEVTLSNKEIQDIEAILSTLYTNYGKSIFSEFQLNRMFSCFKDLLPHDDELRNKLNVLLFNKCFISGDLNEITRIISSNSYNHEHENANVVSEIGKENMDDTMFEIEKLDSSNITVTKYLGDKTEVEIPKTINGKTVGKIGDCAFYQNYKLRKITIPDSVTIIIGARAFAECRNLKTVLFSKNLYIIESSAFSDCNSLVTVVFPTSLRVLDSFCFSKCAKLENVYLNDDIEIIESGAFAYCNLLQKICLPKNLSRIGTNAFEINKTKLYCYHDSEGERYAKQTVLGMYFDYDWIEDDIPSVKNIIRDSGIPNKGINKEECYEICNINGRCFATKDNNLYCPKCHEVVFSETYSSCNKCGISFMGYHPNESNNGKYIAYTINGRLFNRSKDGKLHCPKCNSSVSSEYYTSCEKCGKSFMF